MNIEKKQSHLQSRQLFLETFLSYLRFKKISKFIPVNSRVLDLGCGYNGSFLKKISQKISEGVGIDISVNKSYNEKIRLLTHNLNNPLPFFDNEFDVVVSLANLEHLDLPEKMMAEIYRVLKPGGILLLTTPTFYAKPVIEFLGFKLKLLIREEVLDHKNYFNKKILVQSCQKAGFSFCRHRYFQFYMNNFLYARK